MIHYSSLSEFESFPVVTPACKLPVFHVIAEKGVGHAIYGQNCLPRYSAGVKSRSVVLGYPS